MQDPQEFTTSESKDKVYTCEEYKGCEHSCQHQAIDTSHFLYQDPVQEETHTDHLSINKSYISTHKSRHHQTQKYNSWTQLHVHFLGAYDFKY